MGLPLVGAIALTIVGAMELTLSVRSGGGSVRWDFADGSAERRNLLMSFL
jgi:hypothetical protein